MLKVYGILVILKASNRTIDKFNWQNWQSLGLVIFLNPYIKKGFNPNMQCSKIAVLIFIKSNNNNVLYNTQSKKA